MKTEYNSVAAVLAVALGALSSYFLKLLIPLIVLFLVMLLDYCTGMAKAWVKGELSSRIGVRGIIKKVCYLVIVVVAGIMDWLISDGLQSIGVTYKLPFLLAAIVMVWLILNELISILENVDAIGGPVPTWLTKLLSHVKGTVEAKAGDVDTKDKEEPNSD